VCAELIVEAINLLKHQLCGGNQILLARTQSIYWGSFIPGVFNARGDRNARSMAPLGFTLGLDPRRVQFAPKIAFLTRRVTAFPVALERAHRSPVSRW
jgi:hypothetical protein